MLKRNKIINHPKNTFKVSLSTSTLTKNRK